MSEEGNDTGATPQRPRGEAAWKAHLAAVAARNDQARTAGKKQRQDKEREAEAMRSAQERRVDNELTRKHELGGGR
jgi:hypothetical protein